jgi:hypothetical protein
MYGSRIQKAGPFFILLKIFLPILSGLGNGFLTLELFLQRARTLIIPGQAPPALFGARLLLVRRHLKIPLGSMRRLWRRV